MDTVSIDLQYVDKAYKEDLESIKEEVKEAHRALFDKTCKGNDFLGWVDVFNRNTEEVKTIKAVAEELRANYDVLVVVGIGGSYLGAKAVISALDDYYQKDGLEVVFAGHQLSGRYLEQLLEYLKDKRFAINVISKSGTTTEPAVAFRALRKLLTEKVGEKDVAKSIIATTDASKGALRTLADEEGYRSFVVDDDIGGRFSVFTAVGLLPIAASGHDIDQLLEGVKSVYNDVVNGDYNALYDYVAMRNAFYRKGKKIEMFIYYEPALSYVSEWWKQLFGESEGKDGVGLFVASAGFTTDLHSLGQYIQDGERHLFETVIKIKNQISDLLVESDPVNLDGLNYLSGRSIDEVNEKAMQATLLAHQSGGAPSIVLEIENLDAKSIGSLLYFYELSCALSGIILGVNPFDQPGVEAYKKNMFALLEKPGYEEATKAIKSKIK